LTLQVAEVVGSGDNLEVAEAVAVAVVVEEEDNVEVEEDNLPQ